MNGSNSELCKTLKLFDSCKRYVKVMVIVLYNLMYFSVSVSPTLMYGIKTGSFIVIFKGLRTRQISRAQKVESCVTDGVI